MFKILDAMRYLSIKAYVYTIWYNCHRSISFSRYDTKFTKFVLSCRC